MIHYGEEIRHSVFCLGIFYFLTVSERIKKYMEVY